MEDEFDADAALRAYRGRCRRLLLAGIPCLIALAVAANIVFARASDLERTGIRYPGRIVEVQQRRGFGSGSLVVAFQPDAGTRRRVTITLDDSSPAYEVGADTIVFVDRHDPTHLSIPGETNQSNLTVTPMVAVFVAGMIASVGGIGGLLRARRQASVVQRCGWLLRHGSFVRSSFPKVLLTDGGGAVQLALCASFKTTTQNAGLVGATQFMVAGDPTGYCLIRVPYSDRMLSARPRFGWFATSRCDTGENRP